MNARAKLVAMIAVLLVSACAWTQEVYHPSDPDLLGRFSYNRSAAVWEEGTRSLCLAVSRDGSYRIMRSLWDGETERLQGKMPAQQLSQLKTLLEASDFRTLSGNHGGLIRQDSESFRAEVSRGEGKAQRLNWLDSDGGSPFPDAVAKVVRWLKDFQPADAKSFDYAEYPDVCPSGGFRLLQPSVAENEHP
jgi:hypothetical protein